MSEIKNKNKVNNSILRIIKIMLTGMCICLCMIFSACSSDEATEAVNGTTNKESTNNKTTSNDINDTVSANASAETVPVKQIGSMELSYASQFKIDYYENGYAYILIGEDEEYVLVPDDMPENDLGFENATFIHTPFESIYLAASAAMDLFKELEIMDTIKACSTKAEDYSIIEARERIENNDIVYVGKYSAPDYEKLLELGTGLAIESTMIYHSPKTKEELNDLGIPVLVERSSYEEEPLGRLEWIKLYGLLMNKQKDAEAFFDEQVSKVNEIIDTVNRNNIQKQERPSVVFFYVSSNGYVNVRKPGDYISKMIEMAGGRYALESLLLEEENALSTINISWEDFYAYAKNADILIYNGTIDGGVESIDELIDKNVMLTDCKAIKNHNVYCTNNNMYQETSSMGDIIVELNAIINNQSEGLKYLYKLN